MWNIYFIIITMLGARESLAGNLKKRQVLYPAPNLFGYQYPFPQIPFQPSYYQPNEFAYRIQFWLTPQAAPESATKPSAGSGDNLITVVNQTGGVARKSNDPVVSGDKNEVKNEKLDSGRKSGDKLAANGTVAIENKINGQGNDTLKQTGATLEVKISADNSTEIKNRIDTKNSTTS